MNCCDQTGFVSTDVEDREFADYVGARKSRAKFDK